MDFGSHKHNHLKRQKVKEGEYMISDLPKPLMSRILSIVPTKDAVRTSVLSKRWMHMLRSIIKLNLDYIVFYSHKLKTGGKQYFVNFVKRALIWTKSSNLDSFTLVIRNKKYDVSLGSTWISSLLILNRSLKRLCIHSQLEIPFPSLNNSNPLSNSELSEELVLSMYLWAAVKY